MKYGMNQMLSDFNRTQNTSQKKVNAESWAKRFKSLAGNLKKETIKNPANDYDFFFKDLLAGLRKKRNQKSLYYHLTRMIEHSDFQRVANPTFEILIKFIGKAVFHDSIENLKAPLDEWYLLSFEFEHLLLGRDQDGWKGAIFYIQKDFQRK